MGLLPGLGRRVCLVHTLEWVGDLRRQRDRQRGELVAPDAFRVGVDTHRDRRQQRNVGSAVVAQQQLSHRTGRDRQHHVVDRDAELLAGPP
jgi:hypothetical protein